MTDQQPRDQVSSRFPKMLVTLVVIIFSTAMLGCVLPIAIWPGEAKLTAPLFCEPPYTEPVVVSDTYHDSDGVSTNYSLYCLGEHGQYTEEGFLLPWLALWALHTAIAIFLVAATRIRWRRGHNRGAPVDTVQEY